MTSQATGNFRQSLATNIKLARTSEGLTQRELAGLLDVDVMLVSKWERGAHRPSDGNLMALAETLKRPVAWFYGEHDRKKAA